MDNKFTWIFYGILALAVPFIFFEKLTFLAIPAFIMIGLIVLFPLAAIVYQAIKGDVWESREALLMILVFILLVGGMLFFQKMGWSRPDY